MAELRQERRGTTNFDEKDEIRETMLKERETHREEIRALLTEEQQAYFDKHYRNMRNYNARNSNCGNNKAGKGRGQRNR
jgi:hypothetical protein